MSDGQFGQVLTAMVTPFTPSGQIDEYGVIRLVDHLLETGSDGLVVCGTTGESPTLSHGEKLELFRIVKNRVGHRAPVIAGTGGADTEASIALTREAAQIGVDAALLVVPPYSRPSQEGLYQHFRAIAQSAPDLSCMLYNVPARTAQNLEASTTLRLARDVRNIVATKEAAGNMIQCAEIVAGAPNGFDLYSGDDGLALSTLAVGGVGVVSVTSHVVGRDVKCMHTAFLAGDHAEAARLNCRMIPIVRALFQPTTPSPAPVKAALRLMGIDTGGLRLPLLAANDKEIEIVRGALLDYGLLDQQYAATFSSLR